MNYVDATLVRLGDPQTRSELYDASSLEQIVATAYEVDAMGMEGPYQPVFDEFRVGVAFPALSVVEGTWRPTGSPEKVEAFFQVSGLGNRDLPRVDAFWRGAIIGRAVPATGRITDVGLEWADVTKIDEEIEAGMGALPHDPRTLEQERRLRFLARIRTGMDAPAGFTGEMLDRWLAEMGAASVGELLSSYRGIFQGGAARIAFSPPPAAAPSPVRLPIAAVLLIRDNGFSVAQLLMESKLIQERLGTLSLDRPRDPSLVLRHELPVIWVVPIAVFDHEDWPGGAQGMNDHQLRAARRARAAQWLAREGIALMVTP
jgi:hypothetical protein